MSHDPWAIIDDDMPPSKPASRAASALLASTVASGKKVKRTKLLRATGRSKERDAPTDPCFEQAADSPISVAAAAQSNAAPAAAASSDGSVASSISVRLRSWVADMEAGAVAIEQKEALQQRIARLELELTDARLDGSSQMVTRNDKLAFVRPRS